MKFRSRIMIVFGLLAMIAAPFGGSWEALGCGVLLIVLGSGGLALAIWLDRNPVKPAPMRLFRRRGTRP